MLGCCAVVAVLLWLETFQNINHHRLSIGRWTGVGLIIMRYRRKGGPPDSSVTKYTPRNPFPPHVAPPPLPETRSRRQISQVNGTPRRDKCNIGIMAYTHLSRPLLPYSALWPRWLKMLRCCERSVAAGRSVSYF